MLCGPGSSFNWWVENASSSGDLVTAGLNNVEGSWTQVLSSAEVANDIYGLWVMVSNGNTSAASRNLLLDIGIDPAGGTSYTERIANICCGQALSQFNGGTQFWFPLYIKAGSTVAVRAQTNHATSGNFNLRCKGYGKPTRPELIRAGQYAETLGTIASSNGTAITPGASGAEGAWTQVGTTTKDLWWWQITTQLDDATSNQRIYDWDLAYGDATNKTLILENVITGVQGTAETWQGGFLNAVINAYREVPAGSNIYVRASCNGTLDTGYGCTVVGIGG